MTLPRIREVFSFRLPYTLDSGGLIMSRKTKNIVSRYSGYIDTLFEKVWGVSPYSFTAKDINITNHISYMVLRTQSMFEWFGLPDTIPSYILEMYLQMNGNCAFYQYDGGLYVYTGGLGGEPDVYYRPTIYTISNPAQSLTVNAEIGKDCVVMKNDALYTGLLPLFSQYATSIAETELSLDIAAVNSRIVSLIVANTDTSRKSGEQYLSDIRAGKSGVLAGNDFLDGIRSQPYAQSSNRTITDLIELLQYYRATWFNDLGLNANYNMKRESINSGESQLNNDALFPLIDEMLRCRVEGCKEVNAMFNTDISVSLSSAWEDNKREEEKALSGQPEIESDRGEVIENETE